jgi:TonB family protein
MKLAWICFVGIAVALCELVDPQGSRAGVSKIMPENGTIVDGAYSNQCLGFSYPIPDGWEPNFEVGAIVPEGMATHSSGGGVILLVLDQHTGRPFRNRIVLSSLHATGFKIDIDGFVSKFVRAQVSQSQEDTELSRDTFPANFAGKQFFRADYRESLPAGALYKAFIATKFREHFLGWSLVAGSPQELEESAGSLQRISFRVDEPVQSCKDAPPSTGIIGGVLSSKPSMSQSNSGLPMRVRVSQGVSTGLLVTKVPPQYPDDAKQARIQGQVVLKALIDKNGDVEDLSLVSGHPLLAPAAIEAVKQWKYKPYLLNGQPVKVETQILVNFQLSEH